MTEQCNGHDRLVNSVESVALAAVRSEERYQGFLQFAKWIGGITVLTLMVIAWVGVLLLSRIDKLTVDYQLADKELLMKSADNRREIAVSHEAMKRVEADIAYIRMQVEKQNRLSN